MAILDFTTTTPNNNTQGNARAPASGRVPFGTLTSPTNSRPKATLWLNIGYEAGGKFINLPQGIAIDTMDPADVRGQNVDWVKQRSAQNQLLEALKKMGVEMEPGQEQTLALQIRLRRVSEELTVPTAENEYAVDLGTMLRGNVPEEGIAAE